MLARVQTTTAQKKLPTCNTTRQPFFTHTLRSAPAGSVSRGKGRRCASANALLAAGLSLLMPNTCAPTSWKAAYSSRNLHACFVEGCLGTSISGVRSHSAGNVDGWSAQVPTTRITDRAKEDPTAGCHLSGLSPAQPTHLLCAARCRGLGVEEQHKRLAWG